MGCSQSTPKEFFMNTLPTNAIKPNWEDEAKKLNQAVNGVGTDEEAILSILVPFKNRERQRILLAYKKLYEEDFISVLKSELSLAYEAAILALIYKPALYDAKSLHKAIEDLNHDALIEIICSRKQDVLNDIREVYKEEFTVSLEEDLLRVEDKDLRKILVEFCTINRLYVRSKADRMAAQERAIRLHSYGDLFELLCEPLGRNQLKATFDELQQLYCKPMDEFIDDRHRDKSVDSRRALKAYVSCTVSPPGFFATEIHRALAKINTSESKVLRILVTRSEIDLYYIKKEYLCSYSVQLSKSIQKKCLTVYTRALRIILDIRGQYRESAIRM